MLKAHWQSVQAQPVETPGARGTKVRWLIDRDSGAPNFYMRLFEVAGGGQTPYHDHQHEHEAFIVEGQGYVRSEHDRHRFSAGEFIYVPPNEKHQFVNDTDQPCRFLCLVPTSAR